MSDLNKIQYNGEEYGFADDTIRDLIFYKPGETVTIKTRTCSGYISSSKKNIHIQVILPKSVDLTSGITITSLKLNIRHTEGGYIEQSGYVSGGTEYVGNDLYTIGTYSNAGNCINIKVAKTEEFAYANLNNIPLSIELNQLTMQFN